MGDMPAAAAGVVVVDAGETTRLVVELALVGDLVELLTFNFVASFTSGNRSMSNEAV